MGFTGTETMVEQLRNGGASFEIVSSPNPKMQMLSSFPLSMLPRSHRNMDLDYLCFARLEPPRRGRGTSARNPSTPAMKRIEYHVVQKVRGDGRCMFRSLVKGMAANKGTSLNPIEEEEDADELRMAVRDSLCVSDKERHTYEEALIAITVDESFKQYCQRIEHPDFWGGESELLVLSKMCTQPIIVYIPEYEAENGGKWGTGFIPIAEYGIEYMKPSKQRKARKPVRLLYSAGKHYDLLM